MAAVKRDYYEVLGVSRGASAEEIKRAFRRLARELHPDVSDAPNADERFKEAVEAYEVLSNSERRELYDRYGHEGLRSGGWAPTAFDLGSLGDLFSAFFSDDVFGRSTRRAQRGADIGAEVEIELAEAAAGATRSVPFEVVVTCDACGGSGAEPGTEPVACPTCAGQGRLQQVSRTAFGEFVRTQTCPRCGGAGRVVEKPCERCAGAGRRLDERRLEVEIPPGIHDGQRIRISGEGHAGAMGGRAGDAYVRIRVLPDPRFVREGDDILSTIRLTMTQAALGSTLPVETLDGVLELEFPAGTQPGEVRLLRGRGMPMLQRGGRGDHRVLVAVAIPRHLDAEQERLLRDFARQEDERTYAEEGGLFEKLRTYFR